MKTLVVSDVHGRDIWKRMVKKENPDRIVFLGDYFDSFDIPGLLQISNFKDIIRYKEENTDKEVIMLIGNHDHHYFPEVGYGGTSGYQSTLAPAISYELNQNRKHLQMAYRLDDIVFSHAGVSSEFMDQTFGPKGWTVDNMVDQLNEMFLYKPRVFEFNGIDGYGDDTYQTPIWIRPKSLMRVNRSYLRNQIRQVVGHTGVRKIDIDGDSTGNRYYFTDTQDNANIDYLVYEDKMFSVNFITRVPTDASEYL